MYCHLYQCTYMPCGIQTVSTLSMVNILIKASVHVTFGRLDDSKSQLRIKCDNESIMRVIFGCLRADLAQSKNQEVNSDFLPGEWPRYWNSHVVHCGHRFKNMINRGTELRISHDNFHKFICLLGKSMRGFTFVNRTINQTINFQLQSISFHQIHQNIISYSIKLMN